MNSHFDEQTAISQLGDKVLFCSFLRKIIICTSTPLMEIMTLSDRKSVGKKKQQKTASQLIFIQGEKKINSK